MKYKKEEIFEIIKSCSRNAVQFGFSDFFDEIFKYDYPLRDYIDDCDLSQWQNLSKVYAEYLVVCD